MKPSEIREGGIYRGSGAISERYVDFIWNQDGRLRLHWCAPKTFVAKRADGIELHNPNQMCWLDHFARWAEAEIDFDGSRLLRDIVWVKSHKKNRDKRNFR